jgi:K+-sensing histidine kinase KdpD
MGLRDTINGALTDVRLSSGKQQRERLSVVQLFDEIAATGILHSECRKVRFTVDAVDPTLAVDADPQLLTSAVTNLVQNAFKFTAEGGHVSLRAHAEAGRLILEVEDECGGFPEHAEVSFEPFAERRRGDHSSPPHEPRRHCPQRLTDRRSHAAKQIIAAAMSESLVDLFQTVNVNQQQCQR